MLKTWVYVAMWDLSHDMQSILKMTE